MKFSWENPVILDFQNVRVDSGEFKMRNLCFFLNRPKKLVFWASLVSFEFGLQTMRSKSKIWKGISSVLEFPKRKQATFWTVFHWVCSSVSRFLLGECRRELLKSPGFRAFLWVWYCTLHLGSLVCFTPKLFTTTFFSKGCKAARKRAQKGVFRGPKAQSCKNCRV